MTSVGHEAIIVAAGTASAVAPGLSVDHALANCRSCRDYDTSDWRIWSAVIGNRWADIGGYNVIHEVVFHSPDCFDAIVQDAEPVQYQHALRTWADSGKAGFRRTHAGVRAVIWDRFMRGVMAMETSMWVRDGGFTVSFVKVDRPYFFLGMALHALQDSFSTEHALRTADGSRVVDYKTYVGTPGALPHARRGVDRNKYTGFGVLPQPTPDNGDYVFRGTLSNLWTVGAHGNVKESAEYARRASVDLMTAFEGARARYRDRPTGGAEPDVTDLWYLFESKWFLPDESPEAGGRDVTPPDEPDAQTKKEHEKTAAARGPCLKDLPRNEEFPDYPPFCWSVGSPACSESVGEIEQGTEQDARRALTKASGVFASSLEGPPSPLEDGAGTTPGRAAADRYRAVALKSANTFIDELGDNFRALGEPQRRNAIDGSWNALQRTVTQRADGVRDTSCVLVGQRPGTDAEHQAAETACRAEFDAESARRVDSMNQLYQTQLALDLRGLPAIGSGVPGAPSSPPVPPASSAAPAPAAAPPSGVQLLPGAQNQMLQAPARPWATMTAVQKKRRLYNDLQDCIDDPTRRILAPVGNEEACKAAYEQLLRSNGLR